MKKLLRRIRYWWLRHQLGRSRQLIVQWERDSKLINNKLRKDEKRIRHWERDLQMRERKLRLISESVVEDLEEAEKVQAQQAHVVETLRERIDIYENTTIPMLTSECLACRELLDAEGAIARTRGVTANLLNQNRPEGI